MQLKKKPIGNVKFALGMLCLQMVFCSIILIGSLFKDDTGTEFWVCLSGLGWCPLVVLNLVTVLKYLKQLPESDADKSDDS